MFVALKKTACLALLSTSILTTAYASAYSKEVGTLTVNLEGVKNGGGPLYVSVQTRADFKQDRYTSGGVYQNVQGGNLSYVYKGVPVGEYGVMIWHDMDNNGQFTKDEKTYMPRGGWGASGNELRGEPKFDDVKITHGRSGTVLTIKMHYPNQ
ncbi:MAG: DUF2141 domain-containing protein [Sphingorhabdus sp.]